MREILFRGKNVDTGEWVYGSFTPDLLEVYQNGSDGWLGDWGFIKPFGKTKEERLMVQVERDTVGQYTGLTDAHGRKIFEGDVLDFINEYRGQNNKWKCVVEFIDGCFACRFIEKEGHLGDYNYFGSWNVPLVKWWIIGNRWDNPELLEEAQYDD